uniref:glutathione gamma-glutamylcysteinyltransferase n=1 Tax=Acrobeloides nanus TaxID=290746 RepID=A0A914CT75_9BILA
MSTDGVFVMANYRRQSIGVGASPHMSPIGAYHKDSDMLMILDTNSKYYESAWVPLHLMFDAIKTIDHHANKSRGILLAQLLK